MTFPKLSAKEEYLRYVERSLFLKGGRWIANFDVAFRDLDLTKVLKDKHLAEPEKQMDLLIYGGVKGKGFVLSRAFAFLASPTYIVSCCAVEIKNPSTVKWSTIVNWIRHARAIMEVLQIEWSWVLFFGHGSLPDKIKSHFERFNQREVGLVYADLKNKTAIKSTGFIAKRGDTLFHPSNLDEKESRLKFWKKNKVKK